MKTLKIYDPAMCCSSGVCGPNVNEKLVQLSAFLKGIDPSEVTVERYNLSQQPAAYVANVEVSKLLADKGPDALPLIFVDDQLIRSGEYPSPDELADQLQLAPSKPDIDTTDCCSGGCCS